MKRYDLTVAVTAHNEGLIAHKTMRSILEAAKKLEEKNISYEILIHIDNGDEITKNYFKRYQQMPNMQIFENSFGDPGPSRNFLVAKANGTYISILDGDDLISDNWLILAYELLKSQKEEVIVHPEGILTFGTEVSNVLTLQTETLPREKDTIVLLGENRWCAILMAKTETILRFPYRHLTGGYSHEDYVFNIETTEAGIRHLIAKKTVLFYRRSKNSRLSSSNNGNLIIPYMGLFDFQKVRGFHKEVQVEVPLNVSLKQRGYKLYKKIRNNNFLNYFITPPAKLTLKLLNRCSHISEERKIPKFVVEEWAKINHLETQLYPYPAMVKNTQLYNPSNLSVIGETYLKIASSVTQVPDYIFIVPWLVRGGADKVLMNMMKAIEEIHPGTKFTVITTLPTKNVWAKMLPKNTDLIEFGRIADGLPPHEMDELFSRVITQLKCKRIHVINSEYAYGWLYRHEELIRNHYDLTVSLFASGLIPESNFTCRFSFDDPFIFDIYKAVKKVFTDNQTVIEESIEKNAFDPALFKVHYQPIMDEMKPVHQLEKNKKKIRVLWAGRVTREKMPDVVKAIGEKLNPEEFQIDVYGAFSEDVNKRFFDGVPAVKYCGVFDGFSTLPTENYDILLYTCVGDGMPNIILEAAAAGLPILASNDGGVHEFVQNKKTGVLVDDIRDVDTYIQRLQEFKEDPGVFEKYAKAAQKLLKERHAWEVFVEKIKEDF